MPTTGVGQWTCAVSNLGFIYIYGCSHLMIELSILGSHKKKNPLKCKKRKNHEVIDENYMLQSSASDYSH